MDFLRPSWGQRDGPDELGASLFSARSGGLSLPRLYRNIGPAGFREVTFAVGDNTNQAALGAKIRAVVKGHGGAERAIYRTVGTNSSFSGNSLVELIGLLDAASVAELDVFWATSGTTQKFHDLAADQMIEITEGADSFKIITQSPLSVRNAR